MNNPKIVSLALVAAQFTLIIAICMRALPAVSSTAVIPGAVLIAIACALALAALYTLKMSNLSVMPEPVSQGELITTGPYKSIRHPMYTSVLLGCAGMFLLNINSISAVLLALLCVVLTLKIKREEALLMQAYDGYGDYKKRTSALIPGL